MKKMYCPRCDKETKFSIHEWEDNKIHALCGNGTCFYMKKYEYDESKDGRLALLNAIRSGEIKVGSRKE